MVEIKFHNRLMKLIFNNHPQCSNSQNKKQNKLLLMNLKKIKFLLAAKYTDINNETDTKTTKNKR